MRAAYVWGEIDLRFNKGPRWGFMLCGRKYLESCVVPLEWEFWIDRILVNAASFFSGVEEI